MTELLHKIVDWLVLNDIGASEVIMNMALTIAAIAVIWSMYKLHKANSTYEKFNVVSLIINNEGYLDGAKCIEIGTWLLMCWAFVAMVLAGKLSDAYTAAFVGAWATRGAYGAYLRSKGPAPEPEGTKVVTDVSQKTTTVVIADPPKKDPI